MASGPEQNTDGLYSMCVYNAEDCSDEDLHELFGQFGHVAHLHRANQLVFVRYPTAEEAVNCFDSMKGHETFKVAYGRKKKTGPSSFGRHYRGGSNPFTEQRNGNGDSESGQFGKMSRKDNGYGRRSDGDNSYRRRTDGDSESGQCGEMSRKDIGYGRRSDGDNSYRRRTEGDNLERRSYGRKTENGYGDTGAGGPPKLMICPVQKPVEDNLPPAVEAKVVVVGNIHPKMDQGQIYELVKKVSDTPLHVAMKNVSRPPYPFKIYYALVYVKNDKEVDSIVSSLNNLTLNNYKLKVGPAEKFIEEGKILKARK